MGGPPDGLAMRGNSQAEWERIGPNALVMYLEEQRMQLNKSIQAIQRSLRESGEVAECDLAQLQSTVTEIRDLSYSELDELINRP